MSDTLRRMECVDVIDVHAHGPLAKVQDVVLLPDGLVPLSDGDYLFVTPEGVADAVSDINRRGQDIPFDINHSEVLHGSNGEPSPAYGWGKRVWHEPGRGLMCRVEWTDEGFAHLEAKRYRYLSPVVFHDDGHVVRRVHSAALCNKPKTQGMRPLAASDGVNLKGKAMDLLKKLLAEGDGSVATAEQKMGELKAKLMEMGVELGDGSSFVDIINAAIMKMSGETKTDDDAPEAPPADTEVAASVRVELGLPEGADAKLVSKALAELKGRIGYVPADDMKKVQQELNLLKAREDERNAGDLVEKYLSEGKLNPGDQKQMGWAKDLAKRDAENFKALMDGAPVIIEQGRTTPPPAPKNGRATPDTTAEDKMIEKALSEHKGSTKDAYADLQMKAMNEFTGQGFTKAKAAEMAAEKFPKIFGKS